MDKHLVVISREWHEPFVRVSVTDLDLKIVVTLADFVQAVEAETGISGLGPGVEQVLAKLKRETTKAI